MTWGLNPYFIWGSDIFFVGSMIVFSYLNFPIDYQMGANDNKIILWWGLQAPCFLTSGRDIWVQIVRGKVGLSGRGGRALGCHMTGDSARCPGTACDGRMAPLWPFWDFL